MKLRTGLAAVLSLVISTSMIAFAEDNISNVGSTENSKPSEVVTGEIINQAPTEGAEVVQPPKDVSEVEVPPAVVPPVLPPTEEPEVVVPPVVPPTEEPEVEVPPAVPPTEEPEVVVPPEEVPAEEVPAEEPEVVVPEVVPPVEVPVVVPPVVEVKPATLKIINTILTGEGEEDIVVEEEIKDLVAGQVIDMSKYLHEDEFVKLVNQVENIQLKEGENELIVEYKFREDVQVISSSENTGIGENIC